MKLCVKAASPPLSLLIFTAIKALWEVKEIPFFFFFFFSNFVGKRSFFFFFAEYADYNSEICREEKRGQIFYFPYLSFFAGASESDEWSVTFTPFAFLQVFVKLYRQIVVSFDLSLSVLLIQGFCINDTWTVKFWAVRRETVPPCFSLTYNFQRKFCFHKIFYRSVYKNLHVIRLFEHQNG